MNHAALVLAGLALAFSAAQSKSPAGPLLRAPAPVDDGRSEELEGWRDVSCARCHEDIAREWSTSLHARAWVDAPYREELEEVRRQESCHGCHIPEPLHPAAEDGRLPQKPKPRDLAAKSGAERDLDAHFGVSCESCHRAADGAILGPWGAETPAHASRKHASFLPESDSALCIACHATNVGPVIGIAKDFTSTDPATGGRGCVDCHMQALERSAAREPGQEPGPVRAGRSHALQTPRDPAFLAQALEIGARERGGAVVVSVRNAAGHRVPGRIGRKLALRAELLDAAGAVVAHAEHVIETRRPLAAGETIALELAGTGARVRVTGLHDSPALPAEMPFLDLDLAIEPAAR